MSGLRIQDSGLRIQESEEPCKPAITASCFAVSVVFYLGLTDYSRQSHFYEGERNNLVLQNAPCWALLVGVNSGPLKRLIPDSVLDFSIADASKS
jgi:hypothetical protein